MLKFLKYSFFTIVGLVVLTKLVPPLPTANGNKPSQPRTIEAQMASEQASPAQSTGKCTANFFALSNKNIQIALDSRVISDVQFKAGGGTAYVNEVVWFGMKVAARVNMIEQLQCALSGVGNAMSSFRVLTVQSQRLVATIELGTVELASEQ